MSRRRHSSVALVHVLGTALLALIRKTPVCPVCWGPREGEHRGLCAVAAAERQYQEYLDLERREGRAA